MCLKQWPHPAKTAQWSLFHSVCGSFSFERGSQQLANSLFGLLTYYQCYHMSQLSASSFLQAPADRSQGPSVAVFTWEHKSSTEVFHSICHWIMCGLFLELYLKEFCIYVNINYYFVVKKIGYVYYQKQTNKEWRELVSFLKWFTYYYYYYAVQGESSPLTFVNVFLMFLADVKTLHTRTVTHTGVVTGGLIRPLVRTMWADCADWHAPHSPVHFVAC